MQQPQQPGMPPPSPAGKPIGPLGQHLYDASAFKNNFNVLQFNRIFVSLVAGCVTGIAGITGVAGFLPYLLAHGLLGLALLAKTGFQPQKYFASWSTVALGSVASSTELLTFILFWTLAHNIAYLF